MAPQFIPVDYDPFEKEKATSGFSQESTLQAYNPSWRDKLGGWLYDQTSHSPIARQMVSGLIGSTGLGNQGMNILDFVPGVGQVLAGQEAANNGDYKGAALAMAPIPGAAPLASDASALARSFTPKQFAQAAANYGGGHAVAANVMLRDGPEAFAAQYGYMGKRYPAQVQKTIDALDQMAKPLDAETVLYRSMPVDPDAQVGDVLSHKGFSSTARKSGTPDYIAQDRGERVVKIIAPAGSPVVDLNGAYGAGERGEVVLPRGTHLQLTALDDGSGRAVATLLPAEGTPAPAAPEGVVFDDKLIDIIKKYGIAGVMGLEGAQMLSQSNNPSTQYLPVDYDPWEKDNDKN